MAANDDRQPYIVTFKRKDERSRSDDKQVRTSAFQFSGCHDLTVHPDQWVFRWVIAVTGREEGRALDVRCVVRAARGCA